MQFLVLGRDGDDVGAHIRRQEAREEHLAYSEEAVKTGEQLLGAALLHSDSGQMVGSAMIVEFDNIEAVSEWLDKEAYVKGNVWKDIEIIPCQIGPSFQHLVKKGRA